MSDYAKTTSYDLIRLRENYLENVNRVTDPTGCMIIRELGDIDAELEKRYGKLTPEEWKVKELGIINDFFVRENLTHEDLEAAAQFYDTILEKGQDFYKGKKLMPGQEG
jgi:hypothetical protein